MSTTTLDTTTVRRWNRYPEYRQTKAEWSASIPAGWEVVRLKHLAAVPFQYGANESGGDVDRSAPRFVRITDIDERGQLRDETYCTLARDLARPYLLRKGDILFARSGATVGKTFRYQESWGEACYAGYLIRFRPRLDRVSPEFVEYFTAAQQYWGWVSQQQLQATIQNLSAEKYANLIVPVPPLPEQRAIAAFLDRETARIDALMGHKERLIELLEEKRQAVISHAVTRGLDPNVPLKDSGVPWIGMVPHYWTVGVRFKSLAVSTPNSFTNGPFGSDLLTSELRDEGVPVIYIRDLNPTGYLRASPSHITPEKAEQLKRFRVTAGDVLIAKVGDPPGFACTYPADEPEGIICQDVIRLRPRSEAVNADYLCYWLNSTPGIAVIDNVCVELTRKRFSLADLHGIRFPLPPLKEQAAIAKFLNGVTHQSDAVRQRISDGITRLQEYRTALISAAVTGQIDVRGETEA